MNPLRKLFGQTKADPAPQPPVPVRVNQAVNLDKQAIFIAVPKTGTTSIRKQLAQGGPALIPNPHLTIRQVRDCLYPFLLARALRQNSSFPTDAARVPSDDELREQAAQMFRSFFKFGSVRNPWARVVSLYKRREGVMMSEAMDFEAFCAQLQYSSDTCRNPTRAVNQLDWLTDENGELLVDYVLRLEEHEQGIREINALTGGRLGLESLRLNRNPQSSAHSYREPYTEVARDHVARVFARDVEFFGYEF